MIIELLKTVQFKAFIEIKPTEKGFLLSIQDESGGKTLHLSPEDFDLLVKRLKEFKEQQNEPPKAR